MGEAQRLGLVVRGTDAAEDRGRAAQFFGITAFGDPLRAQGRQALEQVDLGIGIGVRAGGVVDGDRGIGLVTGTRVNGLNGRPRYLAALRDISW